MEECSLTLYQILQWWRLFLTDHSRSHSWQPCTAASATHTGRGTDSSRGDTAVLSECRSGLAARHVESAAFSSCAQAWVLSAVSQ